MKLLSLLPFLSFTISGKSMLPKFIPGQKVLIQKIWFFCELKKGNTIILKDPRNGKKILKRIKEVKNKTYYVLGDNMQDSTDSRVFGWISKKSIIGKVIYVSPF